MAVNSVHFHLLTDFSLEITAGIGFAFQKYFDICVFKLFRQFKNTTIV